MKDSRKKPKKRTVTKRANKENIPLWYVLPVISLFIILLVLTVYNTSLKSQIIRNDILPPNPIKLSSYPFLKHKLTPDISAESAIVIDDSSKVTVYEKNTSLRFSMASTTKIMTALVALEYYKDRDIITIFNETNEGVTAGFTVGEKIYFKDMLYALLLPSANDAANALADNYPGGQNMFIKRMNEKAKELNLNYTHYSDPSGLDDDGDYTTASDLARLTSVALKNIDFARIVSTRKKIISSADGTNKYTLLNLNKLLGEYGVVGVKTGYTQGAGEVLVTSKNENGHILIIVVMKSRDRFADTATLINLISNNVDYLDPLSYLSAKK